MRRRGVIAVVSLSGGIGLLVGCLRADTYGCESDVECRYPERAGACTDLGWCAYMAPGCPSGWQYSLNAADTIAGTCVPRGEEPGGASGGSESGGTATDPMLPSSCDEDCTIPPSDCWMPGSGRCEDGMCVFDPVTAGESCTSECEAGGFCDASGTCLCESGDSSSGGTTEDCESTCIVGEHATAAECDDAGTCVLTCEDPWRNCDGDPANGCEIPVGVPHACSQSGIDMDAGCWTAYCGESQSASATNFGTYYCMDCATCSEPSAGMCHWCDHDTGTFFPTEGCVCGAEFLDVACPG